MPPPKPPELSLLVLPAKEKLTLIAKLQLIHAVNFIQKLPVPILFPQLIQSAQPKEMELPEKKHPQVLENTSTRLALEELPEPPASLPPPPPLPPLSTPCAERSNATLAAAAPPRWARTYIQ